MPDMRYSLKQSISTHLITRFVRRFVFALCGLCLFTSLTFDTAYAQQSLEVPANPLAFQPEKYTEREKIGFAFYKLSRLRRPDFIRWIRKSEKYRLARPMTRQKYLVRDKERLDVGMQLFKPAEHHFKIRFPVQLSWPEPEWQQQFIAKTGKFPVSLSLEGLDQHYFPISLGDDWIAVVPNELSKYMTFDVSLEEFQKKIIHFQDFIDHKTVSASIEMRLKASAVDDGTKLALGDIEAWLLSADILRFTIHPDQKSGPIWERRASWSD